MKQLERLKEALPKMSKRYTKIRKKRSIFKSRIFWAVIALILLLGGFSYLFIFSSVFSIKNINVPGEFLFLDNQKIIKEVERLLPQKILIFELRNIFLIDKNTIINTLKNDFQVIKEVKIQREMPADIIIDIQERKPVANFCYESKCYLVDDTGLAFQSVNEPDPTRILLIAEKISFPSVIEEGLLKAILTAQDNISSKIGIKTTECVFNSLKLEMKTEQGWLVLFDPQKDIEKQVSNLNIVLKNQIGTDNVSKIDYIDVRLDKIFYKLK